MDEGSKSFLSWGGAKPGTPHQKISLLLNISSIALLSFCPNLYFPGPALAEQYFFKGLKDSVMNECDKKSQETFANRKSGTKLITEEEQRRQK